MSILENLKPVREPVEVSMTIYPEDHALFLAALKKYSKEHKGTGEITSEVLFEHLVSPLRQDESIQPVASKRGSRTKSRKKGNEEKVGVVQ